MSHMSGAQQQLRRVDHENAAGLSICLQRRAARSQLFNLEIPNAIGAISVV